MKTRLHISVILLFITVCTIEYLIFPKDSIAHNTLMLQDSDLNIQLSEVLKQNKFTGRIEASLEKRLGRKINQRLAELGRLLFHDTILGLYGDNSCSGCHVAEFGFGDSQSISIGVGNNNITGPNRKGPWNRRRAPMILNTVFYPGLMWDSRIYSLSNDPFDNSNGFELPSPEGNSLSHLPHLLIAQAFIPTTVRAEMVGFSPDLPHTNDGLRTLIIKRLNEVAEYREAFNEAFQNTDFGKGIIYEMLASALAEFEFTLVFANAPIDIFARGDYSAMTRSQKLGALLFFGKAGCVRCHSVAGTSNEMFSDFKHHVTGVPQLFPKIGNVPFDGDKANEDFGREKISGNLSDRYSFRTPPLRNIALQSGFFHNGSFTKLEDALRYHLNVMQNAKKYHPAQVGLNSDLQLGPFEPVLSRLSLLLIEQSKLTDAEFNQLLDFVHHSLLDNRASSQQLRKLVPKRVPGGKAIHSFSIAQSH